MEGYPADLHEHLKKFPELKRVLETCKVDPLILGCDCFRKNAEFAVETADILQPAYSMLSRKERGIIDSINERIRPYIRG